MSSPIPVPPEQVPRPPQMIPSTYPDLLSQMKCSIAPYASFQASSSPSGTKDLADILTWVIGHLNTFTNMYSMILIILQMIACIIEVLCAIPNPIAVIGAMMKLFGTCLPNLILLFPMIQIPAILLCIIKLILSVIDYVLKVLIPLILAIIKNIQVLINAFKKHNPDSIASAAFKIASLFQLMYNILGILNTLAALIALLKALMALMITIPCGGDCCSEDNCPSAIKKHTNLDGYDGNVSTVLSDGGKTAETTMSSATFADDYFLIYKNFFPDGKNYQNIVMDNVAYSVTLNGSDFATTSIDSGGILSLFPLPGKTLQDGYFSQKVHPPVTLPGNTVRFGTPTKTFDDAFLADFDINDPYKKRYISTKDLRSEDDYQKYNNGTFLIQSVIDEYNAIIVRDDSWGPHDIYDYWNPPPQLQWGITGKIATPGTDQAFRFHINHIALMRNSIIGYGCYPAIAAQNLSTKNRFPNKPLPPFPDIDPVINSLNNSLNKCCPKNADNQYILDHYDTMTSCLTNFASDANSLLGDYSNQVIDYASGLCEFVFDPEKSADAFTVDKNIQYVSDFVNVSLFPKNRAGQNLASDMPPGVLNVEFTLSGDGGTITPATEVFDAYGITTGEFKSTLTSSKPVNITITATVCGNDVAYFDGNTFIIHPIVVEFVSKEKPYNEVSNEPLGKGGTR